MLINPSYDWTEYQFTSSHGECCVCRLRKLDVGVLSRHWPGWTSEGTERKNIFQRRENKWPAIQVHPRLPTRPGREGTCDRSCKLKKHASQKPEGYLLAFCETFFGLSSSLLLLLLLLPLDWHSCGTSIAAASRVPRTSGPRCPLPELLYAAFEVDVTFVTAAAVIIGTADRQYIWNLAIECLRDPASIKR